VRRGEVKMDVLVARQPTIVFGLMGVQVVQDGCANVYPLYSTMSKITIFESGSKSGDGSSSFVTNRSFLPLRYCALQDTAALQLGGNAKDRKDDLGKVRGRIEVRLSEGTDAGAGALHLAGDNEKVGRVAREAINRRGDHNIAGSELLHQLAELRPVGRGAGDLLAEYLSASGRLQLL
jgi:hypothetical protein